MDALLHLKDVLRVRPKQTLGKVRNRKKDGAPQQCTEAKWPQGKDRTLCFDESTGALASLEYPSGGHHNLDAISRIEYGAFAAVGGKLVPHEVRALKDRKVIAAVKILEIAKITEENPALFNAPAGAEFWAQCDDMQGGEALDRVLPRYPVSARDNREIGRVALYAVVEANGSLSHLKIIHRATPELEAATIQAVSQWRYKPAICGQTPIRVETSIEMDFWFQ